MVTTGLSMLTFNIGNPSEQRAERQLAWLASRPEHVLVLTETKASAGCRLLAETMAAAGYHVNFPVPEPGGYGVMIITNVEAVSGDFGTEVGYLPARAASVTLTTGTGPVEVIGVYVPSRDAGIEKTERKKKWLAACLSAMADRDPATPVVLLGDLNVLEPGHQPHYPFFAPFEYDFYRDLTARHGLADMFRHLHPGGAEYSWVGRTGDGYRYDHAFATHALTQAATCCLYLHEPRSAKLSDHSALTATVGLQPPPLLAVCDPLAAPATLF